MLDGLSLRVHINLVYINRAIEHLVLVAQIENCKLN